MDIVRWLRGAPEKFIVILAASVVVGFFTRFIYQRYFQYNEPVEASVYRSFPLMAPAVATIFWLVQTSLPLSLGLLGSLSFVRFRTPIKRAEDIAFILILIAASLGCAAGQIGSSFILLSAVVCFGVVRNRFPGLAGAGGGSTRLAVVTVAVSSAVDAELLTRSVEEACPAIKLISLSHQTDSTVVIFHAVQISNEARKKFLTSIRSLDPSARVDIFYPDDTLAAYP